MSKAHLPPIPPANRTDKGPGPAGPKGAAADPNNADKPERDDDPEQQGQQGNTHQNTTHQGLQQAR